MVRLVGFAPLVIASLVAWPAGSALAQFERSGAPPPTGVFQPGSTLTLNADAGDLDTNPAQTGWLRSWSVLLVHTEMLAGARYLGQGTGAFLGFRMPLLRSLETGTRPWES